MTAQTVETLALDTTPLTTMPSPLPALRLVPAPVSLPPYDDEVGAKPALRLVTTPVRLPDEEPAPTRDDVWLAAERTPTAQLPSARVFAGALVQGVLEVLAGVRSLTQLRRDTTAELYQDIATAITLRHDRSGVRPTRHCVRSLHLQERPEGVVEICATVARGDRLAAFALRLEGLDGRWRCTAFDGL